MVYSSANLLMSYSAKYVQVVSMSYSPEGTSAKVVSAGK